MEKYLESISKNRPIKFLFENINLLSIIGWGGVSVYIIIFIILNPNRNTITPMYWDASTHWLEGTALYFRKGIDVNSGFCYFPHAAILNIPFALVPFTLAEVIWRILNIGLLIYGCFCIAEFVNFDKRNISFFLISVFTIVVSYDSMRNGQLNLILVSILCIITDSIKNEKYNSAIFLCILGGALKPYLFIPLLLLCGVFPRKCILPTIVGLILFALFPYFFQNYNYVSNQYNDYWILLGKRNAMGIARGYSDLFGLLRALGLNINVIIQTSISVLIGGLIYLCCLYFKLFQEKYLSIIIYITTSSYILLFSSRTEFNT